MDFIFNGQAQGSVAATLMASNFDPSVLRPFIGEDGRSYISQFVGNKDGVPQYEPRLLANATATLRKDEWKAMDDAVLRIARQRLNVFNDIRAANSFNIPNGMAKTVLEYEDQSDITDASISMDGLSRGTSDRPVYDLKSLPLPIIHKDFQFSARQVLTSRNGNTPLDTTSVEMATRKVAEQIEKLTLGVAASYAYGGGAVYGFTNFPSRMTKSLTVPTTSNQATVLAEILAMRQQAYDAFHYGPFIIFNSPAYDQFLDTDYSASKGDNTLRDRIKKINGISDIRTADYLTGYQLVMVQLTSDVARAVVGMDFTTVQWETQGGMQLNYKVMAIMVPQLRADQAGNTGIVHGTAT